MYSVQAKSVCLIQKTCRADRLSVSFEIFAEKFLEVIFIDHGAYLIL